MKQGFATIYVLLIFMAASIVAAGLMERQNIELVRTAHFTDDIQMMESAQSGEEFARNIISDYVGLRQKDDHTKSWQMLHPDFPIPRGTAILTIEDVSGRFNINSLTGDSPEAAKYFSALCKQLDIPENDVTAITAQLSQTKPADNGDTAASKPAESAPQPNAQPASVSSNSLPGLLEPSELLDYGMPYGDYAKLAPYITALPGVFKDINVNAASDNVLKAYLLNDSQISSIRSAIAQDGTITKDSLNSMNLNNSALTTTSKAFSVQVVVTLNGRSMKLNSILWLVDNSHSDTTGNGNAKNDASSATEAPRIITLLRKWG